MQEIHALLKRLVDLHNQDHKKTIIDIDLMLDHTRDLYAGLLELRTRYESGSVPAHAAVQDEEYLYSTEETESETDTEETESVSLHTKTPAPAAVHPRPMGETLVSSRVEPDADDIRKLIGINDKYQIISELFMNDKAAYENALNEINRSADYPTAFSWLQNHAAWDYSWKEESYTVQLFLNLIRQHFSATYP